MIILKCCIQSEGEEVMRRYLIVILTLVSLVLLAAGCSTSDDGGSGSDNVLDDGGSIDNALTFSEKMEDLYGAYLSSRDSLYADTNAKLAVIYSTYSTNKGIINQQFTEAIENAVASGSSPQKASANEVLESVLEALENYEGDSSSEESSALDAVNEALENHEAAMNDQDSGLASDAESAYDSSSDDGSSIYDAVGDIFNDNDNGSGGSDNDDGASVADACIDAFGNGDGGGDDGGETSVLDEVNSMLEDYNNADNPQAQEDAANEVLDMLEEHLDQPGPEGEADSRSIEEILNDYLNGDATESETLDSIRDHLNIDDLSGNILPIGVQEIALIINYTESMNLVMNGINTQMEDVVAGTVTTTVDIPLGVTEFDFSAEGDILYEGHGTDNITGTTWTNNGTAHVTATGTIHIGAEEKPALLLKLDFTYSFINTTKHPILGDIVIPGEKESISDTVIMEYKNGATYEYVEDVLSNKFSKEITVVIAE